MTVTVLSLFLLALAGSAGAAWFFWPRIAGWFSDSETLFWARLQMVAGAVLTVLAATDLAPVFASAGLSGWTPVWVLISGLITEVARRSRATDV